jgi:NifU-like protein involved in Fe-S cluster formation
VGTTIEHLARGHAGSAPGRGPFMTLHLRLNEGIIVEARYETYQCPGAHACGKGICQLVSRKTLEDASAIKHDDLVKLVGPLPKHRQICYGLAVLALSDALSKLGPD